MENVDYGGIYLGIQSYKMTCLSKYISHGKEYRYFEGENLKLSGDDTFLFYILRGSFKITTPQPDGTSSDLAYCREGSCMQANKLLVTTTPFWDPASFVAMENSIVVVSCRISS